MGMWVKICGNTSLEDALAATEAGADAVGFIFAPSPRQVTVARVAAIIPALAGGIEKIGVFVDADLATIADAVERCGLTGVQIHSSDEGELAAQLRLRFGPGLRILQVIHFEETAADQLLSIAPDPNIDGVLIDSRTATAVGGTGIRFDWQSARATLFTPDRRLRLIAAGGLNPANVAEAIGLLAPWGVDVASGVELSPGRKDAAKVRAFVRNARSAGAVSGVDEKL